jgi:hypothetical protein
METQESIVFPPTHHGKKSDGALPSALRRTQAPYVDEALAEGFQNIIAFEL